MTQPNKIERADIAATKAAATSRDTVPVKVLGWLSEIADQPQLITLCAATAVVGVLARNPKLARTGARMLAAELIATKLKSVIKHRVDRSRPRVIEDGRGYHMEAGDDEASDMNSFPSGHTAGAVAVAIAVARDYPERRVSAYGAAAAVAVIQVPRCQHYPTDLAAGAAIGVVAGGLARSVEAVAMKVLAQLRSTNE